MSKKLSNLTWKGISICLSLLFTVVLLIAGQVFFTLGYADEGISQLDIIWPPFVVGIMVFIGCSLMPIIMPEN